MTYLITFSCYGSHIHGDESGSVDRNHTLFGGRGLDSNPHRTFAETHQMDQPSYIMDAARRDAVLAAIVERCSSRGWTFRRAWTGIQPERIMNDLKSYTSRCLNQLGLDEPTRKRWTRHGSTRYLWDPTSVSAAIQYVVEEQGSPMAVFQTHSPLLLVAAPFETLPTEARPTLTEP